MNSLESQKPHLVWFRLHGPCIGSENKRVAARASNVAQMIHKQISLGGKVVLEANIRSNAWSLQSFKPIIDQFTCSLHRACRYSHTPPCHMVVQIVSNFSLTSRADCICQSVDDHVSWKTMPADVQTELMNTIVQTIARECIDAAPVSLNLEGDRDRQPESQNCLPDGDAPLLRTSSLHSVVDTKHRSSKPSSSNLVDNRNQAVSRQVSTTLSRTYPSARTTTVRFENSPQPRFTQDVSNNLPDSQPHPELTNFTKNTAKLDLQPPVKAASSVDVSSFPTEEAEKAKQRKKAGHVVVKRPKVVEAHHDDCGEDLSSLDPYLVTTKSFEHLHQDAEDKQDMFENNLFAFITNRLEWLRSAPVQQQDQAFTERTRSSCLRVSAFLHEMSHWPQKDCIDVMELFGGAGTTSYILAKRHHFRAGQNF